MCENKLYGFKNSYTSSCGLIRVPGYLSKMLTEWSKDAIRTRSSDLLRWSQLYFHMKANGEYPPVIPYLDTVDPKLVLNGLTATSLKALAMTLSNELETYEKIQKMWDILSLEKKIFLQIMKIGEFDKFIKPIEFIGIAAAFLNNRLRDTMLLLCDTLSKDSRGISLDNFVTVYQYLARLNCTDNAAFLNNNLILTSDDKTDNLEENTGNDSQCFSPLRSHSSSSLGNESYCDNLIIEETVVDDINGRSSEGIMAWKNDNTESSISFTDILNNTTIQPPINTTLCNDPDYAQTIKQFQGTLIDNKDRLSELSVSSVSLNSSIISFFSVSNNVELKSENINYEEYDNEEIINYPLHTESNDNNDEYDFNYDNNEYINDDIISEGNDETSVVLKYEDNNIDIESNNDKINNTDIKINKDFIVMLALVNDDNNPLPNNGSNESLSENESDFSLLNNNEINVNKDENIDINNNENDQIFEDNYLTNVARESSNSEASSNSKEIQYSEINQQSNISVALNNDSIKADKSSSEIISEDDLAFIREKHKYGEQSFIDEELLSAQFGPIEEDEENKGYMYDENEMYIDYSKLSIVDSNICLDDAEKSDLKEKRIIYYLPGVGTALPEKQINNVIDWVTKCAKSNNNYVKENHLIHFLCPKLDNTTVNSNNGPDIV